MTEEKKFENKIKKFLDEKHLWYVKYFANSFTKSGIPDLIVCCNGYFVAIEVKQSKGKPSDLQLYNINQIHQAGGIAIVLYPNKFEEFKTMINQLIDDGYEDVYLYKQEEF